MSEELDREVAKKVMGWRWAKNDCECPALNHGRCERPDGVIEIDFRPSTDIKSAWLVVEKMREHGFDFILSLVGNSVTATFEDAERPRRSAEASNAIAPKAICRAALSALDRGGKDQYSPRQ